MRSTTRKWALAAALVFALAACPACDTAPADNSGTPTSSGTTGGPSGFGSGSVSTATNSASATLLEQLSLERVNRARLRPGAEAANNGIALDEGIPGQINTAPKQPLALNAMLNSSAGTHSADMLARNYFAHNSPEGVTPFDRMNNAGYLFATAGENLAWRGNTATIDPVPTTEQEHTDLFVDAGISGRGHRVTMLNDDFREVGISVLRGEFFTDGQNYDSIMQTQDYGTKVDSGTFVLGVVYNDSNSSGQYDYGEGVSGAAIQLNGAVRTTNSAGGYAFEATQGGAYTLKLPGNRTHSFNLGAGARNIKIDLVNNATIVVNLGVGQLN